MNKLVRASAVLASAVLAVPVWGVQAAVADESVLIPSAAGYFSADGIRKPDESPASIPNATASADGVAVDHLAVAARGGSESKVSFLLFDLFALGVDLSITKAVLTVPVAPDGADNVNVAPAPEKVVACPAGEGGFLGDDGSAIVDAPERLCDALAIKAVATPDGAAYAFDVTSLAQTWATDVNNGVALTSEPTQRATAFQRVFKPAAEAKLALTFTTAEGGGEIVVPPLPGTVTAPPSVGGGGSTDLGTSFDTGSASTPDLGLGTASGPALAADLPAVAPETTAGGAQPDLAAPQVAPTVPVSSTMVASLSPTPVFWLGAVLLAGLLALLSLIMGDPRVAQPQAAAQSRLSQALQERQRASAGARTTARPAFGR